MRCTGTQPQRMVRHWSGTDVVSLGRALLAWGRELHRYTLVGAFVFALDVGIYALILHFTNRWFLTAHLVSRSVGGTVCFVLNRFITFGQRGSCGLGRHAARFAVLYAVSFFLSSTCIWVFVEALERAPVAGKMSAECLVFLFNYTVMKLWVHR